MRRARILASMLALLALAAASPALATSVTVQISGTWDSVIDSAGVLDGSVTVSSAFTATLVYDDATADGDPSLDFGAYDSPAASSDLSVVTGNYSFSPGSDVGIGVENDNVFGEDWIYLYAENYVATGPFPGGVGTGATAYANPTLTDYSASAHGSDALVGLNWNLADYDDALFYLFVEITGQGPQQFLEFQGTITSIQVLPEPSLLALASIAFAGLIAGRLRG
jgi:hypothetical protein